MDFSASTVAAPASQPAPRHVADMRPSADAAASARKTIPDLPVAMPSPPATSQTAEVSRSMLRDASPVELDGPARISAVSMVERTLKPYGISMLPKTVKEAADAASRAELRRADGPAEGDKGPG